VGLVMLSLTMISSAAAQGPGTEMTQIINRLGLGSDCGRCKALAAEMDRKRISVGTQHGASEAFGSPDDHPNFRAAIKVAFSQALTTRRVVLRNATLRVVVGNFASQEPCARIEPQETDLNPSHSHRSG